MHRKHRWALTQLHSTHSTHWIVFIVYTTSVLASLVSFRFVPWKLVRRTYIEYQHTLKSSPQFRFVEFKQFFSLFQSEWFSSNKLQKPNHEHKNVFSFTSFIRIPLHLSHRIQNRLVWIQALFINTWSFASFSIFCGVVNTVVITVVVDSVSWYILVENFMIPTWRLLDENSKHWTFIRILLSSKKDISESPVYRLVSGS